ncbi:hypothetical protein OAF54_02975 [bacterium]|nr:hypothetical protein [bacterium]
MTKDLAPWQALESYICKYLQRQWPRLHKTNRSGGVSGDGDMRAQGFPYLIEAKYRDDKAISVRLDDYLKARKQAMQFAGDKSPVLVRQVSTGERFAIMGFEDWAEMAIELDTLRKEKEEATPPGLAYPKGEKKQSKWRR